MAFAATPATIAFSIALMHATAPSLTTLHLPNYALCKTAMLKSIDTSLPIFTTCDEIGMHLKSLLLEFWVTLVEATWT
jgi:hypothetical protein